MPQATQEALGALMFTLAIFGPLVVALILILNRPRTRAQAKLAAWVLASFPLVLLAGVLFLVAVASILLSWALAWWCLFIYPKESRDAL